MKYSLPKKRSRLFRRILLTSVFCLGFITASPLSIAVPKTPPAPKNQNRPARLLLLPKPGKSNDSLERLHQGKGNKILRSFPDLNGLQVVELPRNKSAESEATDYLQSGLVEFAEPDFRWSASSLPNDPAWSDGTLWALQNRGDSGGSKGADINAPAAWAARNSAEQIIVAVIDSGIRYSHEDLAANMWRNPGEIPNGRDDDSNGIIDDIHGINAISNNGLCADDNGHGTHVAGTIGAAGNNGKGIVGVCWQVQLMACKFMDSEGGGSTSDAIQSINYAVKMGAKVINASWGGPEYSSALSLAIKNARAQGVVFVAAAGNEALDNDLYPTYPANYSHDNIIAVAASTRADSLDLTYSNYGLRTVDLAAPGTAIFSAWNSTDDAYAVLSGTSMAAPHVSGAIALLRAAYPNDSYTRIISRLLTATEKLPSLAGKCASGGRLNLEGLFPLPRWLLTLSSPTAGSILTQPQAADFLHGTEVQLTAVPPPDYEFQSWTGDAAGQSNPVLIVMDTHKTVSATFVPVYTLAREIVGSGQISVSPLRDSYRSGERVELTALPSAGFRFSGWTGATSSLQPVIEVLMDEHKSIVASFEIDPNPLAQPSNPLPDPLLQPQPAPIPLALNKIHLTSASTSSKETFSFLASPISGPIEIQSSHDLHSWTSVDPLQITNSSQGVIITVPRTGSHQFYRIAQKLQSAD